MPENNVLSYREWFAYGMGHILNDVCASMWFTYILIFLNAVLQIDSAQSGAALAIGQIADGISTQIVGIFSDKEPDHWLCRYGRRKIWHLLGTICVFISFPFIFSPYYVFHYLNDSSLLIYYSVFIIVFQFGWASTQISHLSLVSDLTPYQHERTGLLSLRYTFTVLSNIVVYIVFWLVLKLTCDKEETFGPNDKTKFQIVAYSMVIVGGVASFIFHICVREERYPHFAVNQSESLLNAIPSRRTLLCTGKMYKVGSVYIATRLFFNLSQIYLSYYLHAYLQLSSKSLAILPLIMFLSSFATSFVVKPLNVEFGRKITYGIGGLIAVGASVWVGLGRTDDFYYKSVEIYGVAVSFGCASCILLVTSLGLSTDLIGQHTHYGAFLMGIISFGDKISNGIAVLLIENLRSVFDCKEYYRNVLSLCCGVAAIVGVLAILTVDSDDENNTRSEDILSVSEQKSTGHRNNVSENEISFSVTEGKDEQETTSDHNQQC